MKKQNLKTAAPMPKKENKIVDNPMKLYTYLVCISGLATYPEHTRMFRQHDLMLTKIKDATGITDKTVKLYMFYLERDGLIKYQGDCKFDFINIVESNYSKSSEYRKAAQNHAQEVWKMRNKTEKSGIYYIPRPNPYTPIPESTLEKLNIVFQASELELKLYYLCCGYRDTCCYEGKSYKVITFESLRDVLKLKLHNDNDVAIRKALLFLKAIGLIEYQEGLVPNRKGAPIPSFKIKEVNYYISYTLESFNNEVVETNEELKEIYQRISLANED